MPGRVWWFKTLDAPDLNELAVVGVYGCMVKALWGGIWLDCLGIFVGMVDFLIGLAGIYVFGGFEYVELLEFGVCWEILFSCLHMGATFCRVV